MLEIPALPEGGAVSDGFKAEHGEDGDRNSTANRWPREETMALLNIRSDMDAAFRDTSPKAPLWEQVSRKLEELGYHRSAKKCKEKFENIYKYHRRTKEGRYGKSNGGKTYRFFEQLEALHGHNPLPSEDLTPKSVTAATTSPETHDNVIRDAVPCSVVEHSSSSDSYSSGRKKRKLREFFEGLMKEVVEKQEMLQSKFMEVLDKCERDRIAREEAWKVEELARIKRERELLAQERAIAAAKDEAVLAFLKKFTGVQFTNENFMQEKNTANTDSGNGNGNGSVNIGNFIHMSSSRWPKDEVEALIRIRTQLDSQGNNSNNNNNKGPLWEEISLAMKNHGYDRSAKRCKEKWENINKYFKRMKEKNKRKPEDSKTCPYYHHLEALYSKKPKKVDESSGSELKPEELLMHIMGSQEGTSQSQQIESSSEDAADRENTNQNHGDDEDEHQGAYHMVANSPNSSMAIMG